MFEVLCNDEIAVRFLLVTPCETLLRIYNGDYADKMGWAVPLRLRRLLDDHTNLKVLFSREGIEYDKEKEFEDLMVKVDGELLFHPDTSHSYRMRRFNSISPHLNTLQFLLDYPHYRPLTLLTNASRAKDYEFADHILTVLELWESVDHITAVVQELDPKDELCGKYIGSLPIHAHWDSEVRRRSFIHLAKSGRITTEHVADYLSKYYAPRDRTMLMYLIGHEKWDCLKLLCEHATSSVSRFDHPISIAYCLGLVGNVERIRELDDIPIPEMKCRIERGGLRDYVLGAAADDNLQAFKLAHELLGIEVDPWECYEVINADTHTVLRYMHEVCNEPPLIIETMDEYGDCGCNDSFFTFIMTERRDIVKRWNEEGKWKELVKKSYDDQSGLVPELMIRYAVERRYVKVSHKLINKCCWNVHLQRWLKSQMKD